MLQPTTLQFLRDLKINNSKEWMDAHKTDYQRAKADVADLAAELLEVLIQWDERFANLDPKKCLFRINRDIRFSADKSPYKTNFGAVFNGGGKNSNEAAYYLHIEPGGNAFVGGGIWQPEAALLKKIRQEIDYNFSELEKTCTDKTFKKLFGAVDGERLKKAPQGYEADHPAIDYLRLKSFTVGRQLSDKDLTDKNLVATCEKTFAVMNPFIQFLNRAIA